MKVTRYYLCGVCGHDFDGRQRKDDEHIKHCPLCFEGAAKMLKETEEEGC